MEKIGSVNRYLCRKCHRDTFTINLNNGTTPFGLRCPHCQHLDCVSDFYLIGRGAYDRGTVTVTHAFYRPSPERLGELNRELAGRLAADPCYAGHTPPLDGWDPHVLNGGLVLGRLGLVVALPEPEPPYPDDYEAAQQFMLRTYGRRLTRPAWMRDGPKPTQN